MRQEDRRTNSLVQAQQDVKTHTHSHNRFISLFACNVLPSSCRTSSYSSATQSSFSSPLQLNEFLPFNIAQMAPRIPEMQTSQSAQWHLVSTISYFRPRRLYDDNSRRAKDNRTTDHEEQKTFDIHHCLAGGRRKGSRVKFHPATSCDAIVEDSTLHNLSTVFLFLVRTHLHGLWNARDVP